MKHLHPEIAYRIEKLVHRIVPLTDKVFLKTVEARQLLMECGEKTTLLQNQIESNGNDAFRVLTNLEKTIRVFVDKNIRIPNQGGLRKEWMLPTMHC